MAQQPPKQDLLTYMRAHPDATKTALAAAGYAHSLRAYHSRVNEAREAAGIQPRFVRTPKHEKRERLITFFSEHPDAEHCDIVAAGLDSDLHRVFNGVMSAARRAAGVERVEAREQRLLPYLTQHPRMPLNAIPLPYRVDLDVVYRRRITVARRDAARAALRAHVNEHPEDADYRRLSDAGLSGALQTGYKGDLAAVLRDAGLPDTRPYIPAAEACRIVGVTKQAMSQLAAKNKLPHYRMGERLFISRAGALAHQKRRIFGDDPVAYYSEHYAGLTRWQVQQRDPSLYERLRTDGLLGHVPRAP